MLVVGGTVLLDGPVKLSKQAVAEDGTESRPLRFRLDHLRKSQRLEATRWLANVSLRGRPP